MYFRHYETVSNLSSGVIQECFQLFKSEPMFRLMTTLTGLKLSDVDIQDDEDDKEGLEENKSEEKTSKKPDEHSAAEENKVYLHKICTSCFKL